MHFLDDFYLLISATKIVPVRSFCHIQPQHADIVLLTPTRSSAHIFGLLIDSQLFLDELPISDFSDVPRKFQKPQARTPSLIVTPELALSVGNPWASAETPF